MFKQTGDINNMTVPWLLQDIRQGKKTGTAIFEKDETVKKVFFKQGDVLFASSNRIEDRLGEFLLQTGRITQDQFDSSSNIVIKTGKKLGAVLFQAGILSPHDLVDQVKLQVKRIILSLFVWRSGHYRFDAGPLSLTEIVPLHMSTGDLIIEGLRSLDGEVTRGALPPSRTVLRPSADPTLLFQRATLDEDQQSAMSLIDGIRTIEEVSCLTGLEESRAFRAIYVLLALRLVEQGNLKTPEEKDFVCQLVREAFAVDQAAKADPALLETRARKQTIQNAFESLGIQNHYEILGVGHSASDKEIKKAYFVMAKLYHPDRHFDPDMADMKEKLEVLFDKLHEAYETLSSPAARSQYNRDLASGALGHGKKEQTVVEKPNPKAAAAAMSFEEGMKQLNAGNFWGAEEEFQRAMLLDKAKAEYVYYRGLALSRMPRRGHEAEEYFASAIEMAPQKTEYYLALGHLYLKADQKALALPLLQTALKLDPESEAIKQAVKKAGG